MATHSPNMEVDSESNENIKVTAVESTANEKVANAGGAIDELPEKASSLASSSESVEKPEISTPSAPSASETQNPAIVDSAAAQKNPNPQPPKKPIVIIVIGMAGSGKTSLLQRLAGHLQVSGKRGYVVNLDPAVTSLPFSANIDIRDTVNYKNVMTQYELGPNGGIMTSLNLFATKFDEVVGLVEKRASQLDFVLVDTPGQIEIFTWSASGAIITEAFASTFPTLITYVMDTPRSANTATFMSNMLYACGILYKTRLPLLLAFNKVDVSDYSFALSWMKDFEVFQEAVEKDTSYSASLSRSLCLVLDEFYQNLHHVGVSAVTGAGMEEFFGAAGVCAEEYMANYWVELEARRREKERVEGQRREESMRKLEADMRASHGQATVLQTPVAGRGAGAEEEDEEDEDDDEEDGFEEDGNDSDEDMD